MKIALFLPNLCGGGAERMTLDLAKEFALLGHTVEFVLMQAMGDFLVEAEQNFTVIDLAIPRARNVVYALTKYLRRRNPDVLLAAMWPLTTVAPLAARMANFRGKILVSEHQMLSLAYAHRGPLHRIAMRASMMLGYRLASARVGVSQGTCVDMATLAGMSRESFVTIHNPIRQAINATNEDLRTATALWGEGRPRILTVGNLKPVKNHPVLLRAFAKLNSPDAKLMLVGRGENEEALRELAKKLGIVSRVKFAGFQSDPSALYATADLFVLSSDHEGFGNVIVEAMSYGLPIVCTDCPSGPAEILEGGQFGELVPVGDDSSLAIAINNMLTSPVDRESQIRRAASFAPEIAASNYLRLIGIGQVAQNE